MKPSNRLLYEYFEEYASERGNDTFLFDEKICYTVARAFNIAKSLARQLQNAGIKRGDFVANQGGENSSDDIAFLCLTVYRRRCGSARSA